MIHTCPTPEQHRLEWWREYQRTNPAEAAFIRSERVETGKSSVAEMLYLLPGSTFEVTSAPRRPR